MESALDSNITVIEPRVGWLAKFSLREMVRYRELLYFLVWRDVKVRYKQTVLGAAWAVLQPFFTMVVFTVFFGRMAGVPSDGIPYPIFSYAALLPWTYFSNAVSQSGNSLVNNANLITKVYFPRLCIPMGATLAGLVDFSPVMEAAWLRLPDFSFPAFGNSNALRAIFAIAPIAIATIPESTAHLYQISLYVDRLAEDMGKEPLNIKQLIGLNLILDGIGDFINGMLGGCAGTNYGENNSLMAITRNYSCPVLVTAGVIAILLGFIGKLAALIGTLPTAVTGGLAIYLFGVIGLQGIALIQSEKVDLFDPRQLAVGALITVIGIGGAAFPGGNIPVGSWELPSIATSAVVGILLNAIFLLFPPRREPEVKRAALEVVD